MSDYKPKHENLTPSQARRIAKRDAEEKAKQERSRARRKTSSLWPTKRSRRYSNALLRARMESRQRAYILQTERARRMDLEQLNRNLQRPPIDVPVQPKATGPRISTPPPPAQATITKPLQEATEKTVKTATKYIRRTKAGKIIRIASKLVEKLD